MVQVRRSRLDIPLPEIRISRRLVSMMRNGFQSAVLFAAVTCDGEEFLCQIYSGKKPL